MRRADAPFKPGFRISVLDGLVLVSGLFGSIILGSHLWWAGWMVGFVVGHFFLFCNVFRISRAPELAWAGVFVLLVVSTLLTGVPGWVAAFFCSIVLSACLIWRETGKAHYHGVFWERWNPNLPEWWAEQHPISNRG